MRKVIVRASTEYAILIGRGLLAQAGTEIAKRIRPCKAAVITDTTVEKLYAEQVEKSLAEAGFSICRFAFPAGEGSKHIGTLSEILEFLAEEEVTRQDIIVALGGGVTGDMAGFAAAVYQRGIRFVQVPTTFLAAVDSSVGGKTAIDLKAGKNMAGAFYQPHLVLCDVDTLDTLPEETFADGIAETLKYGVIGDEDLFEKTASGDFRNNLEEIIETCVKMKRDIVMEDEFDTGARMKLNLGHTIGHGIEAKSNFTLSHGKAVAAGIAIVCRACGCKDTPRILAILGQFGLPTAAEETADDIFFYALSDKKRSADQVNLILPNAIGDCSIVPTPVGQLKSFIQAGL